MSASGTEPLFLAGPTGVGKSAIAIALAENLGAEIISVDSMQVYRGMDIGTAKPTEEERGRIPHHLIDILDLHQSFDAAQFIQLAKLAITGIQERGRIPLFCGGTGLYFQAYLKGLGLAPASDAVVRGELEQSTTGQLLEELERRDPVTYAAIDRQNRRRLVRALEVIRLTGKPFSEQRAGWHAAGENIDSNDANKATIFFCLTRQTDDLYRRINDRVDAMFAEGLIAETKLLLSRGLAENRTAFQALGYRQVSDYLRGKIPLPRAIELVKQKTRHYAKRQMTWFRHQTSPPWTELSPTETAISVARRLGEHYWKKSAL